MDLNEYNYSSTLVFQKKISSEKLDVLRCSKVHLHLN